MNGRVGISASPPTVQSATPLTGTNLRKRNNMDRDDYNEQRENYQQDREREYFEREPKDHQDDSE